MKTDYVVLGGGISGLLTAAYLERAHKSYILLEALDECGGSTRGLNEQGVWLDYGLKSIPVLDVNENPLINLKKDLNLSIQLETVLSEPLFFQNKSGFVPFVGFGEAKNRALIQELSYYTAHPRLLVANGWKSFIDELLKIIPEKKIKTKSVVTGFNYENEKLKSVVVNGEQVFEATTFVNTLPLTSTSGFLSQSFKNSLKFLQKLDKSPLFTALSIDLACKNRISNQSNMLVFNDDDFYMLGQFVSNCDPMKQTQGLQISSWLTLLDAETAQDDELVSKTLKTMKKSIKKAFPTLIESASWERILVVKDSHFTAPELPETSSELWFVGSHAVSGAKNLYASLKSVQNFVQKAL